MGAPKTGNVRNVVLVGQGGVGKTSLAEAMLHLSGKTARLGGHDGTKPTLDYDPEEVKRAFSISTTIAPIDWKGARINVLDAPCYPDFIGDAFAAMSVCETALFVVDAEAGPHDYTAEQWPLVRRMIHANADFDFNGLTDFHPQAVQAGITAMLRGGTPVVADVEMICSGLSIPRLAHFGMHTHQFISDADVVLLAQQQDTTRAVQAMRKAHRLGLLQGAIVGIGNAPTALIELARLIAEEGVRPALVVGMPVGFVSAAESKDLIAAQNEVPWIVIRGRKGGSTLVVAALHALLALAESRQKALVAQAATQAAQTAPLAQAGLHA